MGEATAPFKTEPVTGAGNSQQLTFPRADDITAINEVVLWGSAITSQESRLMELRWLMSALFRKSRAREFIRILTLNHGEWPA